MLTVVQHLWGFPQQVKVLREFRARGFLGGYGRAVDFPFFKILAI